METNKYDVTIGIPMYNAADFIQRTMESALSQTYDNIEFLVVDDGSTDNSVQKLNTIKDAHPRGGDIRLITLSDNQGPSYVRNLIIEKAQGYFLYFMDADDLIRKDTISLMMYYVH
ncbi:MAG: glycosyltransferase family A protein, partial [Prevotella sp.]|nr:glycosyltransferase family A protein [Prevotella sp.]